MQKANIPEAHQARTRLKAIALVIVAVTCFACLDGTAKYLVSVAELPVTQVVWLRFVSQVLVVVLAVGLVAFPRMASTERLPQQLARSLMMLAATAFNMVALRYLRLDQTTTILFLSPLTVALLAGPLLGEWVGWRRLLAIMVGFTGILLAIRPGFTEFHPAFLLSLGCMLSYSMLILLTRYLAAHDSSETTLFYSMIVGSVVTAPWALMDWVWPEGLIVWIVLMSMGTFAAVGHYLFIVAHRIAPTSTLAPFLYVQLLSVTAFGYLVFGDFPDKWTIAGSAIIVASGIYLVHREHSASRTQ
ncbi:DMT family transporter [Leptospira interrogans]